MRVHVARRTTESWRTGAGLWCLPELRRLARSGRCIRRGPSSRSERAAVTGLPSGPQSPACRAGRSHRLAERAAVTGLPSGPQSPACRAARSHRLAERYSFEVLDKRGTGRAWLTVAPRDRRVDGCRPYRPQFVGPQTSNRRTKFCNYRCVVRTPQLARLCPRLERRQWSPPPPASSSRKGQQVACRAPFRHPAHFSSSRARVS